MNSVQESKNELDAAIRYAENAISSAKQTIESMEFRQEMAKKQYSEQTGREEALEREVAELRDIIDRMGDDSAGDSVTIKHLREVNQELESKVQGQYDNIRMLEDEVADLKVQRDKARLDKAALEREVANLKEQVEFYKEAYTELEVANGKGVPTMPVIPKAVAIAIFREGVAHGVSNACDEIDNTDDIEINESEYCGDFEVSFSKYIDLSEHLDLDWMRDKVGDYDEASVIEALKNMCADKEFECRIHGVDDQEENKND